MVLKKVNWVHNDKFSPNGLERTNLGTQWQKLGHMVLKVLNCIHNDKNGSNSLERSQLGTQYKYRGYLLGQVSFVSLRNLWISVFDVVLLKVELEMWFLQFLSLNLPENCGFCQNLQFSSKTTDFHQNLQFLPFLSFQEDNIKTNRDSMWNERPLA